MSEITTGNLRLISQELLDDIAKAFPAPQIMASTPEAEIKWAAAQHEVVHWIVAKVAAKQTVGTPSPEPGRPTQTGAIVRLGS